MHDKILILDFGSQVTQLIARRVREAQVYCEIHPNDVSDAFIRDFARDGGLKGVILSGSHASTYEAHELRAPQAVWDLGVPVLGICYGMFTMAVQQGGEVEASDRREFGYAEVRARGHTKLLAGIEDFTTAEGHGMLKVWMSHGDKITKLPPGFRLMASTPSCPIAGMADETRGYYGVQFHPEVTHTLQGERALGFAHVGPYRVQPFDTTESAPTCSRMRATASATWSRITQSGRAAAISSTKRSISARPCTVCVTSRWNCTP